MCCNADNGGIIQMYLVVGLLQSAGVPLTFGNDDEAEGALHQGVALVDRCLCLPTMCCSCVECQGLSNPRDMPLGRSHWGRLRVTGRDRLSFLHGQSTAKLTDLQPGEQTETVFTTAQVPQARSCACCQKPLPKAIMVLWQPQGCCTLCALCVCQ